ncbi:YciI family protein [Gallaecimonas sp. GXIMD4217]|uniref:YciI family protein n=1 Tax=Gallaecimonas sp. GXIMD4217 TaxID=3131927 RepID=UPI00311B0C19
MFIVTLSYRKPLSEVDRFVEEHRQYLKAGYAAGHFLLSGRKEPRTGGVILATAAGRDQVEALIEQDPFHREGIADYQITEFLPSMAAPGLDALKQA